MFDGAWLWLLAWTLLLIRVCPAVVGTGWRILGLLMALSVAGGLGLATMCHGYLGDLSVSSWLLLITPLSRRTHCQFTALLLGLGGLLYAGYLDVLPWDTVSWGYNVHGCLLALSVLNLLCWVWAPSLGLWVAVVFGLWWFHGMASTNIWDYGIDVWCVGYAFLWWMAEGIIALYHRLERCYTLIFLV